MLSDIKTGEGAESSLTVGADPEKENKNDLLLCSVLHQGLLFSLRELLPESLREEDCEDPGTGGHHAHDEDRSWQPVHLQEVQEETGDAAYPGHQGAETYCLQRERAGLTP